MTTSNNDQTNQKPSNFNTISESAVTVNGKEFRITATHNTQRNLYSVGIREYQRSERYTGYSKFNGVTIPAPDLQTAQMLANTFTQAIRQTGNIFGNY